MHLMPCPFALHHCLAQIISIAKMFSRELIDLPMHRIIGHVEANPLEVYLERVPNAAEHTADPADLTQILGKPR